MALGVIYEKPFSFIAKDEEHIVFCLIGESYSDRSEILEGTFLFRSRILECDPVIVDARLLAARVTRAVAMRAPFSGKEFAEFGRRELLWLVNFLGSNLSVRKKRHGHQRCQQPPHQVFIDSKNSPL